MPIGPNVSFAIKQKLKEELLKEYSASIKRLAKEEDRCRGFLRKDAASQCNERAGVMRYGFSDKIALQDVAPEDLNLNKCIYTFWGQKRSDEEIVKCTQDMFSNFAQCRDAVSERRRYLNEDFERETKLIDEHSTFKNRR